MIPSTSRTTGCLIKRGTQLISHLQITKRVMQFGPLKFPVDGIGWLGTLHEFRRRGLAGQLLRTAEKTMQRDGAVLGLLSTRIPRFFRPSGWAVCGRHSHARAGSRELLAQLSARGFAPGEGSLSIRPWRQVELPALMRLYQQNTAQAIGPVERNEAYWRWLISRRGFDRIYVAVEGPDKLDLETSVTQIVGYMVTKEDRILELMAAPGQPGGRRRTTRPRVQRSHRARLPHRDAARPAARPAIRALSRRRWHATSS